MPGHQHCKLARMHRSYLVLYTVLFKCAGEVRLGGPWVALLKKKIKKKSYFSFSILFAR